jgi:hypothetical protein
MITGPSDSNQMGLSFTPNIGLPPDHRLLMQAIMALARPTITVPQSMLAQNPRLHWRRPYINYWNLRGLMVEFIDQTIRRANGLEGVFAEYLALGNPLPKSRNVPVSRNTVVTHLAGVRNGSAHAGQVPTADEAIRAVEVAHSLVMTAHPYP